MLKKRAVGELWSEMDELDGGPVIIDSWNNSVLSCELFNSRPHFQPKVTRGIKSKQKNTEWQRRKKQHFNRNSQVIYWKPLTTIPRTNRWFLSLLLYLSLILKYLPLSYLIRGRGQLRLLKDLIGLGLPKFKPNLSANCKILTTDVIWVFSLQYY